MEIQDEYKLNLWLPSGITLAGIGVLALITPAFADLSPGALIIDLGAGGVLTLAGVAAIVIGRKKPQTSKIANRKS